MKKRFIAVGDNCVDDYTNLGKQYAGGCSLNFSVYIRQLGGLSEYLGIVGDDPAGAVIQDELRAQDVAFERLKVMPGATAVTKILLEGRERKFLDYEEGVLGSFCLDAEDIAYIRTFDCLHSSVYGKIEESMIDLSSHVTIGYDFAYKFDQQRFLSVVPYVDYAFLSYEKDDPFIRSVLKDFVRMGARCAVATLGAHGSIAFDGETFFREPGHEVEVVDTLGAGDSFIAGFLYARSGDENLQICLKRGAARAEETIGRFGAF